MTTWIMSGARQTVRALGFTLTRKDGEYRLNTIGGTEAGAYYTNDLEDAVQTARAWCRTNKGQHTADAAKLLLPALIDARTMLLALASPQAITIAERIGNLIAAIATEAEQVESYFASYVSPPPFVPVISATLSKLF